MRPFGRIGIALFRCKSRRRNRQCATRAPSSRSCSASGARSALLLAPKTSRRYRNPRSRARQGHLNQRHCSSRTLPSVCVHKLAVRITTSCAPTWRIALLGHQDDHRSSSRPAPDASPSGSIHERNNCHKQMGRRQRQTGFGKNRCRTANRWQRDAKGRTTSKCRAPRRVTERCMTEAVPPRRCT